MMKVYNSDNGIDSDLSELEKNAYIEFNQENSESSKKRNKMR